MLGVSSSRRLVLACVMALGGALASSQALASQYQLSYSVPTPDEIFPLGLTPRLNNSGRVATGALIKGLAYYDGANTTYTPTDGGSYVNRINDASVMTGSVYRNDQGVYTAFVATPTSYTNILLKTGAGVPAAGVGTGINNAGLAVGYYGNPGSPTGAAFTYDANSNTVTTLNLSPVGGSTAFYGVSESGVAVGTVNVAGSTAAVTYNPTTASTFILPAQAGAGATAGRGLTSTGTLIGVETSGTTSSVNLEQGTPFLYTAAGVFTALTIPSGWTAATIEGFNDHGDFVGALINGGTRVGYVYSNGAYTILNSTNVLSGGPVYTAWDIDDADNIAVTPSFSGNSFVLAPVPAVPEPAALAFLVPVALIAGRRRARTSNRSR